MTTTAELLAQARELLNDKPKKAKKPREYTRKETTKSGKGYAYTRDSNGNQVSKARLIMEEHLGHPLPSSITVGYQDGDKTNLEVENLVLCLRAGVPIASLICTHCGSVGTIRATLEHISRQLVGLENGKQSHQSSDS